MSAYLTEAEIEEAALEDFRAIGYSTILGRELGPDWGPANTWERKTYADVLLVGRLRAALVKLNEEMPDEAIDAAIAKLLKPNMRPLEKGNREFHRWLIAGVPVSYRDTEGKVINRNAQVVNWDNPEDNDWLAVNQFTIIEPNKEDRRPDVIVFVNGLPLAVLELKNPGDENATMHNAYNQLQFYAQNIPSLFPYNEVLVISDYANAFAGSLTAPEERFMPWRTIDGEQLEAHSTLEVLIKGMFDKTRFLDLLRYFVVFEDDGAKLTKKLAAYHQYHAVNKAVAATLRATDPQGDKRVGVVWHTQGSGKSLSMAFYAGKLTQMEEMANPTIVVITDRNDLDDQLFATFAACNELMGQLPLQADSREHLRKLLGSDYKQGGGVIFTTIQKFLSEAGSSRTPLSERRNIVVIADEAHRSQYDFQDGLASNMREALPKASFIGFTGTPIDATDRNTRNVFGEYIDTYDIKRSIADKATVPIYYEARMAKLVLDEGEQPKIDKDFEEATEGEEQVKKDKLKSKWAQLAAVVGAKRRLEQVAADIVSHFESRELALDGKGMIVCMSRDICRKLYDEIIKVKPEWGSDDDNEGAIKVVMSGDATDEPPLRPHIRSKARRDAIAKRFKDPKDKLKLVIVRDMWLTGFDVPPLHTMYIDKPMKDHNLMQAIARVNRVFGEKQGGLIVDYIGIAYFLQKAIAHYSPSDKELAKIDQSEAVVVLQEKYEIIKAMMHGYDYNAGISDSATTRQRIAAVVGAIDHILALKDGKSRFLDNVTALTRAFQLAVPSDAALALRHEVGFFQAMKAQMVKSTPSVTGSSAGDRDAAIQQIVDKAVAPAGVVDIFAAMGVKSPDVSIFSDEFLAEIKDLPQQNLTAEAMMKLISDQIKARQRRNVIKARSFAEMLRNTVAEYQNRTRSTGEILNTLIELARQIREEAQRSAQSEMSNAEIAFYDALAEKTSPEDVLGDEMLHEIAKALIKTVKANIKIDWRTREDVRAGLQAEVKKVLRHYKFPPDKVNATAQLILLQADALGEELQAA